MTQVRFMTQLPNTELRSCPSFTKGLHDHGILFPVSINTTVSVSDKLTWLSDKCHSYECYSKVLV